MLNRTLLYVAFWVAWFWPFVNMVGYNIGEFRKSTFLPLWEPLLGLVVAAVVSTVVLYVLCRMFRSWSGRILTTACIGVILFFNFSQILVLVGDVFALFHLSRGGSVAAAGVVLVLLAVTWVIAKYPVSGLATAVGIISMGAVSVALLLVGIVGGDSARETAKVPDAGGQRPEYSRKSATAVPPDGKPNVYYIVADALTGPVNYKRISGESLPDLFAPLTQYGFTSIGKAHSNYMGSASSIGSLFHLTHFRDENSSPQNLPKSSYFPAILYRKTMAPTLAEFAALGYDLVMSGSWYSSCSGPHLECVKSERFYLNRETINLLKLTPIAHLFRFMNVHKVDAITPVLRNWLPGNGQKSRSTFVFMHHMQPHGPWFFNGDCQRINTIPYSDRQLYPMSVQCVAKTFIRFVDEIAKKDPGAIIVMHGDHGWLLQNDTAEGGLDPDDRIRMRSEISNFVKAPERCLSWLKDGMGPVNTMRFVLACIRNEEPVYLDEPLFIPGENYATTEQLVRFKR